MGASHPPNSPSGRRSACWSRGIRSVRSMSPGWGRRGTRQGRGSEV
uniref:Uncharacterized protein n=1 Tax=Nannochloropsis gaditana (strain CCMP526) TaxID=1093141 RepID=I2CP87_NANGC